MSPFSQLKASSISTSGRQTSTSARSFVGLEVKKLDAETRETPIAASLGAAAILEAALPAGLQESRTSASLRSIGPGTGKPLPFLKPDMDPIISVALLEAIPSLPYDAFELEEDSLPFTDSLLFPEIPPLGQADEQIHKPDPDSPKATAGPSQQSAMRSNLTEDLPRMVPVQNDCLVDQPSLAKRTRDMADSAFTKTFKRPFRVDSFSRLEALEVLPELPITNPYDFINVPTFWLTEGHSQVTLRPVVSKGAEPGYVMLDIGLVSSQALNPVAFQRNMWRVLNPNTITTGIFEGERYDQQPDKAVQQTSENAAKDFEIKEVYIVARGVAEQEQRHIAHKSGPEGNKILLALPALKEEDMEVEICCHLFCRHSPVPFRLKSRKITIEKEGEKEGAGLC